jgi:short-subunit dehydrogenase
MEGLADVLRIEMQGTGISVSLIEPGPVTSAFREKSRARFERFVDWQGSVRDYTPIRERLYGNRGPDPFELPASSVTRALVHAVESPRPRRRYPVTVPAWTALVLRRLLPAWAVDRIVARL